MNLKREDILLDFQQIKCKEDLSLLLSKYLYFNKIIPGPPILFRDLDYFSRPKYSHKSYQCFEIPKKSGGVRKIHAPVKKLKTIQKILNEIFQIIYEFHDAATGFIVNKSIVDNATRHVGKSYVLNIDLQDFFHSFERNQIKSFLMGYPLYLDGNREPIAFMIACLCTYPIVTNNEVRYVLPQGSPVSPTLTNLMSRSLDNKLSTFAYKFDLTYSRYADDITFSGDYNFFAITEIFSELEQIIEDHGKKINFAKTRYQRHNQRQEVTGLIVNSKINVQRKYVKQVRMWLYYWEKYGYTKADNLFKRDYSREKGHVKNLNSKLENVLSGKLDFLKMVKGSSDHTYLNLLDRYKKLCSNI